MHRLYSGQSERIRQLLTREDFMGSVHKSMEITGFMKYTDYQERMVLQIGGNYYDVSIYDT